jgi:hypothetical protein
MHSAMQTYYSIKQSRMESLGDFRRRFDAAQASMRQSGVWCGCGDDEAQAVSYANALDRSRFGQFLVDYRSGLLGHLDTVDLIQQAESYVTLRFTQSGIRTGQIVLASEVAEKAPKSAKRKGQRQGVT